MKRKILSIALVLGMMLSTLSIPSVGASDTTVADSLPYFFNDFEDGVSIFSQSNTSIVDGGIGGGKALKIVEGNTDTCKDYPVRNSLGSQLSGTIPAGATVKVSFWVKLSTALTQCDFSIISFDMSSIIGYPKGSGDKASTNWQKVTIEFTASSDASFNSMMFRTGNVGTNCNPVVGATASAPGDRAYLIDDFEIAVYKKGLIKSDKYANLSDYYMGFESGAGSVRIMIPNTGYPNVQSTSRTNNSETFQVVANPSGSGKVMKYDMIDTLAGDASSLALTASTATGNWGGNNKPASTLPDGATITYTFKYYWAQEMSTDNTPAFCVRHATTGTYARGTEFSGVANQWHTATLTYTNNTGSNIAELGRPDIRFCAPDAPLTTWKKATLATGETYGVRTVYIDDIEVKITTGSETQEVAAPTSSALMMTGSFVAGSKVTFSQNFTAQNSQATDESVVKVMNTADGLTCTVAYAKIGSEMTVPTLPEEGTLSFCVVPIDSDDLVGQPISYTYAEVVGFLASLELCDFAADGSITAKVNMENMKHNQTGVNAVLVVLMYDVQGAMVKYESKGIVCPYNTVISGETAEGSLTVSSDTTDPAASQVAIAEAYLWDCGTAAFPTFKNTTMKELAADITVVK